MKHTLTILSFFICSFAFGQAHIIQLETTPVGTKDTVQQLFICSIFPEHPISLIENGQYSEKYRIDTIGQMFSFKGYSVREYVEHQPPAGSVYAERYFYWKVTGYLDNHKKTLPKNIKIWMAQDL